MKILHVVECVSASYGGIATAVLGLARAQALHGHSVTVFTTNLDYPHGTLRSPGESHELGGRLTIRYFGVSFKSLSGSGHMAMALLREVNTFDIVHVHGLYRLPGAIACWVCRMRHRPYVVMPHGSLDPVLFGRSSKSVFLKRVWETLVEWPNLRRAARIHYTSVAERDRAASVGVRGPSVVVPNGLDMRRFADLPPSGEFRKRVAVMGEPLVLFLSRVNFKKGLDLLIPAFAAVRERVPRASLAIVGPDNEGYGVKVRGWIREYGLSDCVYMVGPLEGVAVLEAYVDSDVFVLPSYSENFGMVVAESLACRTPVVISDQVNICEDISDAGAGLVTRCDASEIADALVSLLCDSQARARMGMAGSELVKRKWAWESVVHSLDNVYEEVAHE